VKFLEQLQEAIPSPLLSIMNWGAFYAGLGYFFTTVIPAGVGVLSGVWLGCQIWLFFTTKPWRRK
jgi:hypothetical protein